MIDLKPCPFCGGKAEMEKHNIPRDGDLYTVRCLLCGAAPYRWCDTPERAAEKWNLRARKRRVKDD